MPPWHIIDLPGLLLLCFSWVRSTQYRQLASKPQNSPTRLGLLPYRAITEVSTVAWQKWSMNNGSITLLRHENKTEKNYITKDNQVRRLSFLLFCSVFFSYALKSPALWTDMLIWKHEELNYTLLQRHCLSTVVWITGSRTTPSLPLYQSKRGCCA